MSSACGLNTQQQIHRLHRWCLAGRVPADAYNNSYLFSVAPLWSVSWSNHIHHIYLALHNHHPFNFPRVPRTQKLRTPWWEHRVITSKVIWGISGSVAQLVRASDFTFFEPSSNPVESTRKTSWVFFRVRNVVLTLFQCTQKCTQKFVCARKRMITYAS